MARVTLGYFKTNMNFNKPYDSQRGYFAYHLYKEMEKDVNVYLLTGDLGRGMFDKIREDFPNRFFNCGAAEQSMLDIAVGLALEGKIPVCYSITPFLLARPYEVIRNYIDHESISVKLFGAGRGQDYEHDGFSHYAEDVTDILLNFKNIKFYFPEYKDIEDLLRKVLRNGEPTFVSLKR